jgi:hypothetical protein
MKRIAASFCCFPHFTLQGQKRMAQKTAARGRPKGTGLDDAGPLAAIAELIAANPGMKPTTAIKALGISDPSTVRRLRDKYQQRYAPRDIAPTQPPGSNVIALKPRSGAGVQRNIRPADPESPQPSPPAAQERDDGSSKASDEHPAPPAAKLKPDLFAAAYAASIATAKTAIHLHYKTMWYAFQLSPYACLIRNNEFTHLVLSSLTEKDKPSR